MIKSSDMSNTIPDEKVVITYVSYLCARLLDIRKETRAARVIQAAWRRYQLGTRVRQQQVSWFLSFRITYWSSLDRCVFQLNHNVDQIWMVLVLYIDNIL